MIFSRKKPVNNMFGLDSKTIEAIRKVLSQYPQVKQAKIFGSRALGTERPNSDIDIALWGQALDWKVLGSIQADLDEISSPYKFDVAGYHLTEHQGLREHIDRVGKPFYP